MGEKKPRGVGRGTEERGGDFGRDEPSGEIESFTFLTFQFERERPGEDGREESLLERTARGVVERSPYCTSGVSHSNITFEGRSSYEVFGLL